MKKILFIIVASLHFSAFASQNKPWKNPKALKFEIETRLLQVIKTKNYLESSGISIEEALDQAKRSKAADEIRRLHTTNKHFKHVIYGVFEKRQNS